MRTHRCRFACFTIAQWEKEAAWLRQQHQKGWQFTHLTAGVFYHFAPCPPEDVVYHLEYQDQKDLEAEPLQSLRRRGWAYVDRFTQYFYFRKPAKDLSPEEAALLHRAVKALLPRLESELLIAQSRLSSLSPVRLSSLEDMTQEEVLDAVEPYMDAVSSEYREL